MAPPRRSSLVTNRFAGDAPFLSRFLRQGGDFGVKYLKKYLNAHVILRAVGPQGSHQIQHRYDVYKILWRID